MDPQSSGRSNSQPRDLPSIFDRQQEVRARIDRAAGLLLFLDFDGTLAPIAPRPALAELPNPTRGALSELAALAETTVAIVSGRALEDVRQRVGIAGLIYAGNHGLEIEGRGLSFQHPGAVALLPVVSAITTTLTARSSALEGVEVEVKGLTTSVHYRQAPPSQRGDLERLIGSIVARDDPRIEITSGKMVHEIRPRVDWDKGKAVVWIRNQLDQSGALPFVIGDDMTDETAFTGFDDAVTICVDPRRPTGARYHLESPEDVRVFLGWLARIWKDDRRENASRHHGSITSL